MEKNTQGFSLIEVLVALVIAGISLSWFLYVLSHSYYTSARLFERLKLFDAVSPLKNYLLLEIRKGTLTPDKLNELCDDSSALSSYTTLPPEKVVLQIKNKEIEFSFENTNQKGILQEYNLIVQEKDLAVRLLWQFYSQQNEQP